MEEVRCERCGGAWLSPGAIVPEVSREVASLLRSGRGVEAIRRLREATGLSLRDAKGVWLHVTREQGQCHRCGAALPGGRVVSCTRCRSLNYDW